jgi:RHS repeat-associated protein
MRYLDGLAVDEILAQTDASGDTSWYLTNQLGSVVAIASTSAVLDQIVYDPFGNIVTQTNATDAVRFGFAGMEFDSTTGLYYDHARYYDAAIGRFVSQDPKGFAAGDTDLYRYVRNSPTDATDPSGELPFTIPLAIALANGTGDLNPMRSLPYISYRYPLQFQNDPEPGPIFAPNPGPIPPGYGGKPVHIQGEGWFLIVRPFNPKE